MLKLLLGNKNSKLTEEQIKEPFLRRVEYSLKRENFHGAVAFLNSAIDLLPDDLDLYFQRAQILHFGLCDFHKALKDYRFIMCQLSTDKSHPLYRECKGAIGDMMDFQPHCGKPVQV